MRHTTGGYRASEYERIQAADSGGYLNRKLYAVSELPGIWRRVKEPKVPDPAAVGILACWFDGGIIFLEPSSAEFNEITEGGFSVAAKFSAEAAETFLTLIEAKASQSPSAAVEKPATPEIPGTESEPAAEPKETDPFDGPTSPDGPSTADVPQLEM